MTRLFSQIKSYHSILRLLTFGVLFLVIQSAQAGSPQAPKWEPEQLMEIPPKHHLSCPHPDCTFRGNSAKWKEHIRAEASLAKRKALIESYLEALRQFNQQNSAGNGAPTVDLVNAQEVLRATPAGLHPNLQWLALTQDDFEQLLREMDDTKLSENLGINCPATPLTTGTIVKLRGAVLLLQGVHQQATAPRPEITPEAASGRIQEISRKLVRDVKSAIAYLRSVGQPPIPTTLDRVVEAGAAVAAAIPGVDRVVTVGTGVSKIFTLFQEARTCSALARIEGETVKDSASLLGAAARIEYELAILKGAVSQLEQELQELRDRKSSETVLEGASGAPVLAATRGFRSRGVSAIEAGFCESSRAPHVGFEVRNADLIVIEGLLNLPRSTPEEDLADGEDNFE